MKKSAKIRFVLFVIAVFATPLMAFTLRGGDNFEIYVGKRLAVQQFLHMDKTVKTVDLSATTPTENLRVTFSHCGQTGTNRKLVLKDQQRILKEWKFANVTPGGSPVMAISIKDIVAVQKDLNGKNVSLFYSSDLMKDGKVLVNLATRAAQASAR